MINVPTSTTTSRLDAVARRVLLRVAARAIDDALGTGRLHLPDTQAFPPELQAAGASFVTLERDERLLGCIGTLRAAQPLAVDVAHNAVAAAFADPRLPAVTHDDFTHMSIKISVLAPAQPLPVSGPDELLGAVQPHVDGLVLEAGRHRSTLLPSVWPKVRDAEEFLAVLWHKAGLVPGTWSADTRVSRYTTEEFADFGPR